MRSKRKIDQYDRRVQELRCEYFYIVMKNSYPFLAELCLYIFAKMWYDDGRKKHYNCGGDGNVSK